MSNTSLPAGTRLLAQIASQENLALAWRKVRGNIATARRATSCGVDEISVAAFEQQWEANLAQLSAALLDGSYRPLPVRRVAIPKPGGQERTIGVLAVRDRIAQRAAQQVLEPIFEAQFLDCSYGFRPGQSVQDAIHRVLCYRQAGCNWVFDADVTHCFDSLDHGLLLGFVSETVREEPVIDLIQAWLEAGLLETDAAVAENHTLWNQLVDRAMGAIKGQIYGEVDPTPMLDEGGYGGMASQNWERRSLWRSVRSDLLLLGLTAVRPLARRSSAELRRLARRREAKWAVAGLAGAAALGGAWWTLQHLAPKGTGALQGGALSPLLANVYLHRFDRRMVEQGRNLVRYADDLVICCESESQAHEAGSEAARALADLRLRLHPEKTRVVSFREGFRFLGTKFQGEGLAPTPVEQVRRLTRKNGR